MFELVLQRLAWRVDILEVQQLARKEQRGLPFAPRGTWRNMSRVGSRWKLSSLLKSELLQLSDVTNGTVAVRVHINAVFRNSSVVEGAVVEHQVNFVLINFTVLILIFI